MADSLEVRCLRDGTLDCDLDTGLVYGLVRGQWVRKRLGADSDGYLHFNLSRDCQHGKRYRDVRKTFRRRHRRYVRVNRLVKIKALAVAKGGDNWRQYVVDLPPGVDVNHRGRRDDNRAYVLELQTESANRARREMTDEEWAEIRASF